MRNARRASGFTLIEILVVLVIIAVLIALLLPAIQAAREAARASQCRQNLHQIGVALHTYHNTNKRFPIGVGGGSRRNWIMQLLPYIEEGNLYNSVDWNVVRTSQNGLSNYDNATGKIKFDAFTSSTVPVLLCPSDKFNEKKYVSNRNPNSFAAPIYQTFGRNSYGGNACLMPPFVYAGQWGLSGSDAMPCGSPTMASWATDSPYSFMSRGVMGPSASMSMKQITDGLSNSVAIWEIRTGITMQDFRGSWADDRPAASMLWFHIWGGPNTCWSPDDTQSECQAILSSVAPNNGPLANMILTRECMRVQSSSSGNVTGQPRSTHLGGAHAVFCDASVHFVSDFIETGFPYRVGAYTDFQNLAQGWAEYRLRAYERINASADGLVVSASELDGP